MSHNLSPTYIPRNGKVYAFFENRIIASGDDFKSVEKTAVDYLDSLSKHRKKAAEEQKKAAATHITTPNGVKGKILNRVEGIFGEKEITVRLDNGRVAKLIARGDETWSNEKDAATIDPVDAIQAKLDEDYTYDTQSLATRLDKLDSIKATARVAAAANGATYEDQQRLDKIVLLADAEKMEIESALDYLKQADAETVDSEPHGYKAVDQAPIGHSGASGWLTQTAAEMVKDAESINYDKLLAEEPTVFVASLEKGTLESPESVATMAYDLVVNKTAAFTEDDVVEYREKFVASAEMARRRELEARTQEEVEKTTQKEAATKDFRDEELFL